MQKTLPEPDLFPASQYATIEGICSRLNCPCHGPGWVDRFGEALHSYIIDHHIPGIRTLSLFSGAGGLDIGFRDLGFDIVESVEVEERFCQTLIRNSGKGRKFDTSVPRCVDIRDYMGDDLGPVDFIIGGPPCQTFSAAGRRQGGVAGMTDGRGVLFREYVRLLEKLQPRGFLFENVYGIIGAQNGMVWQEIQKAFSAIGYHLFFRIVDAADYGVPQHRERLIIVGLKEGRFLFPRPTHGPDSRNQEPFYSAGVAVSGLELSPEETKTGISGRFGYLIDDIPPGLNYSFYTAEMGHPNPVFAWRSKFSDFMYKADPECPVRTIKAQGGQYTGPLHWDSRYFALSEFKRLQTFPDDYEICGVKAVAVHQIGNSVPPQLARMMALAIRMQVFHTEFPFELELLDDRAELSFRKRKRELTKYYQAKAREAIAQLSAATKDIREKRAFYVSLSDRFRYRESDAEGEYRVELEWADGLHIAVGVPSGRRERQVTITIRPRKRWTLPVTGIQMDVFSGGWMAVTVAWKVLDRQLTTHRLMADLVQLNGYYQYESKLDITMSCWNLPLREVFQSIYNDSMTGKKLTTTELARIWNVNADEVMPVALKLKELGYEIRNSNTNPQIPEGVWLLPYKFPTLLPESVQTYKTLI